jgi:hypothetical protein
MRPAVAGDTASVSQAATFVSDSTVFVTFICVLFCIVS